MTEDNEEAGNEPASNKESETAEGADAGGVSSEEEQSFRERVEEIRQKRAEEGGEGDEVRSPAEGMMGGGMGGGGGGMGGNPFAEMMGGMMGGGMGPGGRGGSGGDEELTREVRKLRDEVHDMRRTMERIADALED